MATCSKGHANPDTDDYCGVCGEPVLPVTVFCPAGHLVLAHQRFCPECGAPIAVPGSSVAPVSADVSRHDTDTGPWYQKVWGCPKKTAVKVVAIGVAGLLLVGVIIAIVFSATDWDAGDDNGAGPTTARTTAPPETTRPTTSSKAAIREWWAQIGEEVREFIDALRRGDEADGRGDIAAMKAACQQIDDAVAVRLQARLPSPDPALTTAVQLFIDDVDTAAQICMSWGAFPNESQTDEFRSAMDQAMAHFQTARGIVDAALK